MIQLIDRQEQIKCLENEYRKQSASLIIIYGRRRVGKTTLISKFVENKNALFFTASQESEDKNKIGFINKAQDYLLVSNDDLNVSSSWDEIFKSILKHSADKKHIIIIDEFQYIGMSNPAFPSILQRIWEEQLKDSSVMLILCGSLISMMVSQTLSYSSPLYGRRTAQIRLGQIPFKYYHEFYDKTITEDDLITLYSITGGVPLYIKTFSNSEHHGIYENIKNNILNRNSYLYEEPNFLLKHEVDNPKDYFNILKVIADGNTKLSKIATILETKLTTLNPLIKTLIALDIIEKDIPITEKSSEDNKSAVLKIKDNYLRFWFIFVYQYQRFIEEGHLDIVMNNIKNNLIQKQVSYVYEDVCREMMWELSANNTWKFYFSKVGRYWENNIEIDIAAMDISETNLVLGECKYRTQQVDIDILKDLESKVQKSKINKTKYNISYILFSRSGFTTQLRNLSKTRGDLILVDSLHVSSISSNKTSFFS